MNPYTEERNKNDYWPETNSETHTIHINILIAKRSIQIFRRNKNDKFKEGAATISFNTIFNKED